jgi:hypothetical protein
MCSPLWARPCSPKGRPRDGTRVTRPPLTLTLSSPRTPWRARLLVWMPLNPLRRLLLRPPPCSTPPIFMHLPVFHRPFLAFSREFSSLMANPAHLGRQHARHRRISTNKLMVKVISQQNHMLIGRSLDDPGRPGRARRKTQKISTSRLLKMGIMSKHQVVGTRQRHCASHRARSEENAKISTNKLMQRRITKLNQMITKGRGQGLRDRSAGLRISTIKLMQEEIIPQNQTISTRGTGQDVGDRTASARLSSRLTPRPLLSANPVEDRGHALPLHSPPADTGLRLAEAHA